MTALHQRIPNRDHEGHVLAVRHSLCDSDPLAIVKMRLRARWVREQGRAR
jgi:hypothetical protein